MNSDGIYLMIVVVISAIEMNRNGVRILKNRNSTRVLREKQLMKGRFWDNK